MVNYVNDGPCVAFVADDDYDTFSIDGTCLSSSCFATQVSLRIGGLPTSFSNLAYSVYEAATDACVAQILCTAVLEHSGTYYLREGIGETSSEAGEISYRRTSCRHPPTSPPAGG